MNDITLAEYLEAKKITEAYEQQERDKAERALELMKLDLDEYFKHNLVGGFRIEEVHHGLVRLRSPRHLEYCVELCPVEPYFEGEYSDEKADAEIRAIGNKHGFDLGWASWVYPK